MLYNCITGRVIDSIAEKDFRELPPCTGATAEIVIFMTRVMGDLTQMEKDGGGNFEQS